MIGFAKVGYLIEMIAAINKKTRKPNSLWKQRLARRPQTIQIHGKTSRDLLWNATGQPNSDMQMRKRFLKLR